MRKSHIEIANLGVNSQEMREWLLEASAKEIQQFIHRIADAAHRATDYQLARTAIDIRLGDDAGKQVDRLEKQMVELTGVAVEQKRLAAKLDAQTDRLVSLTVWLKWLTIVLLALTALLCFLEVRRSEVIEQSGVRSSHTTLHIDQQSTVQSTNH